MTGKKIWVYHAPGGWNQTIFTIFQEGSTLLWHDKNQVEREFVIN